MLRQDFSWKRAVFLARVSWRVVRRVRVSRVRADSKIRVPLSSSWLTSVSCMCDYASASGWFRDKTTEIRTVVSFVKATRCSLYWCRDECFRQRSLNRITRRRCDGGPISVESKREIGKCSRRSTFPWWAYILWIERIFWSWFGVVSFASISMGDSEG